MTQTNEFWGAMRNATLQAVLASTFFGLLMWFMGRGAADANVLSFVFNGLAFGMIMFAVRMAERIPMTKPYIWRTAGLILALVLILGALNDALVPDDGHVWVKTLAYAFITVLSFFSMFVTRKNRAR